MRGAVQIIFVLFILAPRALAGQEAKLEVPDAAGRKSITKEIHTLFKGEYAKRDLDSRRKLAAKLLDQALQSLSDPASCFVLLSEARILAAEGGDVTTALAAVDKMVELFDVAKADDLETPLEMKDEALGKAARFARSPGEAGVLAEAYLSLAREAAGAGDFRKAEAAARKATSAARKARDKALATWCGAYAKELPEIKREFEYLAKADLTGAIDVGDSRTNLNVGRYLCFVRNDWAKGLEYLLWSGDTGLSDAAKKDLDGSDTAGAGDAWYALAEGERHAFHKARYQRRALTLYEKALETVTGVARLKIEKRVDELLTSAPGLGKGAIPITGGLIGAWNLSEGRGTSILDVSGKGLKGEVTNSRGSPSWAAGTSPDSKVLEFRGTGEYVKIEGATAWNTLDDQLTIAAWIYKASDQPGFRSIASRQIGTTIQNHFYLGFISNRLVCWVTIGGRQVRVSDSGTFPVQEWVHVAMVYDGSNLILYRGGQDMQSLPARGSLDDDRNPVTIGGDYNGPGKPLDSFQGRISRVRIYNRALKASEIRILATRDR